MHQYIHEHLVSLLSKFQCSFREGFSAQHCFLMVLKKMKTNRYNKGALVAVLTDFSKAFDCMPHGLLISKLNAFGFDKKSPSFISTYFYKKKLKTKIGSEFSDFLNMAFRVPQESILGPILYIIFITD